ncbi:MAG: LuxR C-terminal-related transcriptional regulator [Balneolaceae bacterium]
MNRKERWTIAAILTAVAVLATVDIFNDYFEGVALWHLSIEISVAVVAVAGVFYLIRGRLRLQHTLAKEKQFSKNVEVEAEKWKRVSKIYTEGLSVEIDNQLNRWGLTTAEKMVAFLLIKGLSNKEIAKVKGTSVQTVRTQTNAIYTKSGLSGRSELSAFFLEDLLLPK